ncbi:MAG: hypothetical protein U0169_17015 [Polyangiaceae bacterium]
MIDRVRFRPPFRSVASLSVLAALLGTASCSKSDPPAPTATTTSPSATAATSPGPTAAKPATTVTAAAPGTSSGSSRGSWSGKYTSAKAELYVPAGSDVPNAKDWSSVKWRGEDDPKSLGEGTLALTVDDHGRVAGTVAGPLGEGLVDGVLDAKGLRANVRPKGDAPFSGTILGEVKGDSIEGTMKSSTATGHVLRVSKFSLAKS